MIATALVFALGALVATLVALLVMPLLWRNAQRLARREFEATIPTGVKELRAEADAARAEAAFAVSREAIRGRQAGERAAAERAEAGRTILENGRLAAALAASQAEKVPLETEIATARDRIAELLADRDRLTEQRQSLLGELEKRMVENAALAERRAALAAERDALRQRLAASEPGPAAPTPASLPLVSAPIPAPPPAAPADPISIPTPVVPAEPAVAPAETQSGSHRLRAAIRARSNATGRDASENADLRERISDIAARVIQSEVVARGPRSTLARLFEGQAGAAAPGAPPTLADRVRTLLGPPSSSVDTTPAAAAPDVPVKPAGVAPRKGGATRSRPRSRR